MIENAVADMILIGHRSLSPNVFPWALADDDDAHTLYWVICKDYLRLVDPANSAASLLLLSRLEGNSDIRNESWRLKGDVRDCKRLNSRKEVCLCNMRSVA